MQPPSPDVIFFIPSKLKHEISPKLPTNFPLCLLPKACAASATTRRLFDFPNYETESKQFVAPTKYTGIIALVFAVILF